MEQIEQPLLESLLSLSVRCRLLQEGGWIHCGDGMQYLMDSRAIAQVPEGKRAYLNCPAFSFGVRLSGVKRQKPGGAADIQGQLRVLPFVYRVLPLRENEEKGRTVYCLPRLASPAVLEAQGAQPPADTPLKTKEDFRKFWYAETLIPILYDL